MPPKKSPLRAKPAPRAASSRVPSAAETAGVNALAKKLLAPGTTYRRTSKKREAVAVCKP